MTRWPNLFNSSNKHFNNFTLNLIRRIGVTSRMPLKYWQTFVLDHYQPPCCWMDQSRDPILQPQVKPLDVDFELSNPRPARTCPCSIQFRRSIRKQRVRQRRWAWQTSKWHGCIDLDQCLLESICLLQVYTEPSSCSSIQLFWCSRLKEYFPKLREYLIFSWAQCLLIYC